jgi:DNA processing protein
VSYSIRPDDGSVYPAGLLDLKQPPQVLFLRGGHHSLLQRPAVAIVGARSCSPYGAAIARILARKLAAAGVVVVSGLARGIDANAHRGALDANGHTVAVLGCGIDINYPAAHEDLARRIMVGGEIVSEYAQDTPPAPWRFPARNRIIAALSMATIVVEARQRSGALITADYAMELGRPVFAVPGEITSALSEGTLGLIKQGAQMLTSTESVLHDLDLDLDVNDLNQRYGGEHDDCPVAVPHTHG